MKNPHSYIIASLIFLLGSWAGALGLEDIVRLSKAEVGDEIIINIIQASDDKLSLTADSIIALKKAGVSDKVIIALIKAGKKTAKKQQEVREERVRQENNSPRQEERVSSRPSSKKQELKPFDQFFLSTYYSHDYGWPEKNYDSPSDILSQGLYYQAPQYYPNSRKVRVYGFGHSVVPGTPNAYTFSPYSILVPRNPKGGAYYGYYKRGGRYYHKGYHRSCDK